MNPLVSIAVITYNSSKYVLETLESAKAQTYQNIELVISDDCSTDNTVQLCKDWVEQNESRFIRIQIVEAPQNTGVSANCNRAEDACQAEWVKIIAGDDLLLPTCIEDYVKYVTDNPDAIYVFGRIQTHGGNESLKNIFSIVFDYSFFKLSKGQQLDHLLFQGNCIPAASSFYNKQKTRQINLRYDERIPMLEDLPRWINALKSNVHFYFLDKETVQYRIGHSESLTASGVGFGSDHSYKSSRLYEMYYVFEEYYKVDKNKAYQYIVDYEMGQRNALLEYYKKYMSVLNSHAFRLGSLLLKPVYWVKQIFHDH